MLLAQALEKGKDRVKVPSASECTSSGSQFRIEGCNANSIQASDRKKRKRGCGPAGELKLRDRLTELHRTTLIDQYIYPYIFFFNELPKHQALEPREDAPINMTEVISCLVFSKVTEFDRSATPSRSALTSHRAGKRSPRLDSQVFQFSQEGGI